MLDSFPGSATFAFEAKRELTSATGESKSVSQLQFCNRGEAGGVMKYSVLTRDGMSRLPQPQRSPKN